MKTTTVRHSKILLSGALLSLLAPLAAQNTAGDFPIPERFKQFLSRYDRDGNGRISPAETQAMPERLRTRIQQMGQGRGAQGRGGTNTAPPRTQALPGATSFARVSDAAMLELARQYNEAAGGQTFIVMHQGKVVHESYANGGGAGKVQMLASGSKSFVGAAAAAAVQDGLIRLDDAASESLTEWRGDARKGRITYRQLLSLTSGLIAGERGMAARTPAWREIIAKPMSGEPGAQFEYGAYHLNAFGEALQRKLKAKSGESFESYLKRRILDPIGIKVEWRLRCADGNPQLGGGAYVTARDWVKYGEWMRLGGRQNSRQIVDEALLKECLVGTPQNPAYGLTWWLKEPVSADLARRIPILRAEMGDVAASKWLPEDLFMAAGAGKQRLYVIPSLQLTIVRQAPLSASRQFEDTELLSRLLRGQSNS